VSDRALEALPADVVALVDLERQAAAPPAEARARVAARLGLNPAGTAAPAGAVAGSGLVLPVTALAIAAGGLAVWLATRAPDREAGTPVAPEPRLTIPVRTPPPPAPAAVPVPAPPPARPPAAAVREVALLASARKALAAGNPGRALALVRRHEQQWPQGELVQEREVMAVQALAASGATAQARARADRFLARFPGSTLAETVRRLRGDAAP
jgi:hypothetical protein